MTFRTPAGRLVILVILSVTSVIALSACNSPTGAAMTPQPQATLTGGQYRYSSVTYSPDGKLLAAGNQDRTITLWDLATKTEAAALRGHASEVLVLAFSPNGQTLASGSADETVKLWDVTTKRELATFAGHGRSVTSVAFTPDGKQLATATGSTGGLVRLWDVATGRERIVFRQKDSKISSQRIPHIYQIAFAPDGNTLAIAINSGIILWDVATETERTLLEGKATTCFAFAPDGKTLATRDVGVTIWDLGKAQVQATLDAQSSFGIVSIAFSPKGTLLAIGLGAGPRQDSLVKIWDVTTRQQVASFPCHTGPLQQVTFSPDGKTLATAGEDKTVKLWDVALVLGQKPGK